MNAKPLFCMTSAGIQQGCCAGWLDLHCWPATGCPMPPHPLAEPVPQQHLLAPQVHWQCLPTPVLLSLSLPLHPQFLPKGVMEHRRVICNSSFQQGYSSRRDVCPLDITYIGFCFAKYIFRGFTAAIAALYWLGVLNYCLMMITLCCLFVIPCRNGWGVCRWTLIWENSSNRNPANSGK